MRESVGGKNRRTGGAILGAWGAGALLMQVLTGCGGSAPQGAEPETPQASTEVQNPAEQPLGGSNYRFAARAHHPHPYNAPPQHPALTSLPAFVDGSEACFGSATVSQGQPAIVPGATRGFRVGASGSASVKLSASGKADLQAELKAKASLDLKASASLSASASASAGARVHRVAQKAPPAEQPKKPDAPQDRSQESHIYLSNDDTMSLSSAQRLMYAIDEIAPIKPEEIRPHEFLNYFTFETAPVEADHDFSVLPRVAVHPENPNKWTIGLSVSGRTLTRELRRNANLSFVLDRSGSMSQEGRLDFVRRGLQQALTQVKDGDVLHITLFDSQVCQLAENFVVGRDSLHHLRHMVERIGPQGSTDLDAGLRRGYQAADAAYRPEYGNRVLLITDALTNTGTTDEDLIALVGKQYDDRRIRLSGVGVGRDFNDSLIDELTERGKGAYVFLGKGDEVDRIMGEGFTSLIEPIATNVHFILHLPPSLSMKTFYGEEASMAKEKVQAIHYFSGTKQMFLVDVESKESGLPESDDIMFTIEYTHPDSGESRVEEHAFRLMDLQKPSPSLNKAHLVSLFARELTKLAERPVPSGTYRAPETWGDPEAFRSCLDVRDRLEKLALPLSGDDEAHKVRVLWDTYCRRYKQVDMSGPAPAPASSASPSAPATRGASSSSSAAPTAAPPSRSDSAPSSGASPKKESGRNNEFAPE